MAAVKTKPETYPTAQQAGISESEMIDYGNIVLGFRVLTKQIKKKHLPLFIVTKQTSLVNNLGHHTNYPKGIWVIIPIVTEDGREFKANVKVAAQNQFNQTHAHLGAFQSEKSAEKYKVRLTQELGRVFKSAPLVSQPQNWTPVKNKLDKNSAQGLENLPFAGIVSMPGLSTEDVSDAQRYFLSQISEINVSYSMDDHTSVKILLTDPGYKMTELNYFVPRRDMLYRGRIMEIADVSVSASDGPPQISVTLCNKAIQQMKRSKMLTNVIQSPQGNNSYAYAASAARKFGLGFNGEPKSGRAKEPFMVNENGTSDESVWDVLNRAAKGDQKVVFEMDGLLVCGSHEWLMWKFGNSSYKGPFGPLKNKKRTSLTRHFVPLLYLGQYAYGETDPDDLKTLGLVPDNWRERGYMYSKPFLLETFPTFETSDNDPLHATGSCSVQMPNGGQLRPGYTAIVGPLPSYFFGGYIIDSVSFKEGSPESASVSFRTPEELINQWIEPNPLPYRKLSGSSPLRDITKRNEGVY